MAKAELTRRIYSMGAVLGMVDSGSHADDLHVLVYRISGKTSVRELTEAEAQKVVRELKDYIRLSRIAENAPPSPPRSMMSEYQKKFAFRLLYRLKDFDLEPAKATVRERMIGIVEKVVKREVKAEGQDIFATLSEAEGSLVIEELKRYVSTAAKRDLRRKNERSGLCENRTSQG